MAWFTARLKRAPKHTRFSKATAKAVKASLVWHLSHPWDPGSTHQLRASLLVPQCCLFTNKGQDSIKKKIVQL